MLKEDLIKEMARQEGRQSKSNQGLMDQVISETSDKSEQEEVVDILEYVRAEWGLNENPFPVQRFLLKIIFGLVLDDRPDDLIIEVVSENQFTSLRPEQFRRFKYVDIGQNRALKISSVNTYKNLITLEKTPEFDLSPGDWVTARIETWDMFRENVEGTYTESEFFDFLYGDGPGATNCRISLSRAEYNRTRIGKMMNLGVIRIGRRGTKCCNQDTLCHTSEGLVTLKEIAGVRDKQDMSWNLPLKFFVPDGEGNSCLTNGVYDNGIAKVIKLTTSLGTELEATPEHRIWVMNEDGNVGWRYVRDLKIGDFICHSRKNKGGGFGDEKKFSIEQFELWGFYVGDGNVTETQGKNIAFTVESEEERPLVEKLIKKVTGRDPKWIPKKKKDGGFVRAGTLYVGAFGKNNSSGGCLRNKWRLFGFGYDVKSRGIPFIVRTASKEQQSAFLRGLFEADGCAASDKRHLFFTCKHKRLAHQVQLMLFSFGIVSRIGISHVIKDTPYWSVNIHSNKDRKIFMDEINFLSARKRRLCAESCLSEVETDFIPHQKEWVKRWYNDLRWEVKRKSDFRDYFKYAMNHGDLTISRLERLLAKFNYESEFRDHFQSLYDSDYYYSEVVKLEAGEAYTRDLSVPESERYIAGGMITHNSSLASFIAGYFCYKVLKKYHPQSYYQVKRDQAITMTLMATSRPQAQELLAPTRAAIKRSPYLRRFVELDSAQRLRLNTAYNIDHGLGAESGINVTSLPCSAKSARGPANLLGILEEFGFYYADLEGSDKSDKEIFGAVAPSTADLINPDTGEPEGMVLLVSTPLTTESYMHDIEESIWERKNDLTNSFVIHLPSYWTNPNLATDELKKIYYLDPSFFYREYGANYTEQLETALQKDKIELCRIDPGGHERKLSGEEVYMGFDLALTKDWTAISIVAMNGSGEARLIFHEAIGFGQTPGYEAYVDIRTGTNLDIILLAQRVDTLWDRWGVKSGAGDQFNSWGFQSHLKSAARESLDLMDVTMPLNDQIAKNFIAYIEQCKLKIYYPVSEWDNFNSLVREISRLKKLQTGGMLPKIKLIAPKVRGAHDDQYSALSRALYVGQKDISESPPIANTASRMDIKRSNDIRARVESERHQRQVAVRTVRPTGKRFHR